MSDSTEQETKVKEIEVEVVYALPRCTHSLMLNVPVGTTVRQALDMAVAHEPFDQLNMEDHQVGIYYEVVNDLNRVLNANERIEIYRPLINDPMQQRHARAEKQSRKD